MLATVLRRLTDFLTGAIMESRKAARSKAVADPPWLYICLHDTTTNFMLARVHPGSCTGARISLRYEISQRYHVNTKRPPVSVNLDPELFCAYKGEGSRALGNPGARFVSDWFQQKTIKVFLIGLFKFARERLNVRRVWRVSGFFP